MKMSGRRKLQVPESSAAINNMCLVGRERTELKADNQLISQACQLNCILPAKQKRGERAKARGKKHTQEAAKASKC